MKTALISACLMLIANLSLASDLSPSTIAAAALSQTSINEVKDINTTYKTTNTLDKNEYNHYKKYILTFRNKNSSVNSCELNIYGNRISAFGSDKKFISVILNDCLTASNEVIKISPDGQKDSYVFNKIFTTTSEFIDLSDDESKKHESLRSGVKPAPVVDNVDKPLPTADKPVANTYKPVDSIADADDHSADAPEAKPKSNSILKNSTATHIGAAALSGGIVYGVSELLKKKSKIVPAVSSDSTSVVSSDSTTPSPAEETEPAAEPIMSDEDVD